MKTSCFQRLWIAGLLASLPAFAGAECSSLYERLGGADKIAAVVDEYVQVLSDDSRTRRAFEKTDLKRIKRVFTAQLCDLTGGPCRYNGDSMRDLHAWHPGFDSEPAAHVVHVGTAAISRSLRIPAKSIVQLRQEVSAGGAH